jgi:hypothetical protein
MFDETEFCSFIENVNSGFINGIMPRATPFPINLGATNKY